MALIKCPECGREVSSSAAACPGCGFKVAEYMADLVTCPECGSTVSKKESACPNCGFGIAKGLGGFHIEKDGNDKKYSYEKVVSKLKWIVEQVTQKLNIKNEKIVIGVAAALVLLIVVFGVALGSKGAKVSSKRIEKDMSLYDVGKLVEDSHFNAFDVEEVEIRSQRTQKKAKDEINCVITYRNKELDIIVPFVLVYNYYDQGWVLDHTMPGDIIDFVPRKGADDELVASNIAELELYDKCESVRHDTKIEDKVDYVTAKISTNTDFLKVSGSMELKYEFVNGEWCWVEYSTGDDYKADWNLVGTYERIIEADEYTCDVIIFSVKENKGQSAIADILTGFLKTKGVGTPSVYWDVNEELEASEYITIDLKKTFAETRLPAYGGYWYDKNGFFYGRDFETDINKYCERISDEPIEDLYSLLKERYGLEYLFPENVLKVDKASGESEIISSNGLEGEKFRELFEDDLSVSNNKEYDNNTNSKENFIPNLYLYGGNYKVEDSDNIIGIDSVNRNAKESEFAGVLSDSYGNRYDLTYLGRESLWEPYQVNVDVFAIADNPQFGLLCGGMGEEYPFVWLIDPEDYIWECSYILSE